MVDRKKDDDDLSGDVHAAIRIDNERDIHQDPGYGIRQLADIALRALSPGVNDPTTALNCIGYLGAILERLTERQIPEGLRRDPDQKTVVLLRHRSYRQHVEDAFVKVGRFARSDARVVMALIKGLGGAYALARQLGSDERAELLRDAAEAIAVPTIEQAATTWDRESVEQVMSSCFPPAEANP